MSGVVTALAWSWALLVPSLVGAMIARAVLGRGAPLLLVAAAGVGVGHGATSVLFFCLALAGSASPVAIVALEALLVALAALALAKGGGHEGGWPATTETPGQLERWARRGAVLAVAICLVGFVLVTVNHPHGGWDAWAIWNLRARFFARDGFAEAFRPELSWSNLDYPLLLPSSIARAWRLTATESLAVPALVAAQFWAATVGLLFSGLERLRGAATAAAGVAIALAAPAFTGHAAAQYADVPVGSFLLAAVVLATTAGHVSPAASWRPLALAGAHAGLAVWTKNEGALMFVSLTIVAAASYRSWPSRSLRLTIVPPLLGALLPLLVVLLFKLSVAPASGIFAGQSLETVGSRSSDAWRWSTIVLHVGDRLLAFAAWPLATSILLCGATILARFHPPRARLALGAGAVVALVFTGFLLVYAITPFELEWHLRTSADRLLLQLWPSAVFAVLLALEVHSSPLPRGLSVGAIVLATVVPIGQQTTAWRDRETVESDLEAELRAVAPHLPPTGHVWVVTGTSQGDPLSSFFRSQYSLAPRLVVAGDHGPLVVAMAGATVRAEETFDLIFQSAGGVRVLRRRGPP